MNVESQVAATALTADLPAISISAKVSVIMPSHNHARFIERAVHSVLAQTYSNVELIVIDDGSCDDTVHRLRPLADEHGFRLIEQANVGVCATLNRGVREFATGEWIGLLASDDFWAPDKLRLQLEALAQAPASRFVYSQAVEFTDDIRPEKGRVFPRSTFDGSVLDRVFIRQGVPAGTMVFARSLYDEIGGFDTNLKEEDWDFVIRSAAATPFTVVSVPLLYYRSHAGNTMKVSARTSIFQQKAKILAKNFHLVSPWRWLIAMLVHFVHDVGLDWVRRNR